MKTSEVLRSARDILEDYELSHGRYARGRFGVSVDPRSDEVCSLCSVGAIARALDKDAIGAASCRAVEYLARALGSEEDHGYSVTVFQFNDKSTREEVIDMFNKAIKLAEEDERDN